MSNLVLYVIAVLIWGSTWLAIKFQLGSVAPAVSVGVRFAIAAALLFVYAARRRLPLRLDATDHGWLAIQGLLMFGINYVTVYLSERTLPSGIVAVIFSLAVFFNLIGARICFGTPIQRTAMAGALLGCGGVVLVFWPQIAHLSTTGTPLEGVLLAVVSALIASVGNIVASRNHRAGQAVVANTAWSMLYGSLFVGLYAVVTGDRLTIDWSVGYIASLLYLAVFGSVVAFTAYLTLMKRIGPGKAGYSSVAIPVVALLLSTMFEALRWQPVMVVGALLCLAGNLLVLQSGRAPMLRRLLGARTAD